MGDNCCSYSYTVDSVILNGTFCHKTLYYIVAPVSPAKNDEMKKGSLAQTNIFIE